MVDKKLYMGRATDAKALWIPMEIRKCVLLKCLTIEIKVYSGNVNYEDTINILKNTMKTKFV